MIGTSLPLAIPMTDSARGSLLRNPEKAWQHMKARLNDRLRLARPQRAVSHPGWNPTRTRSLSCGILI